MFQNSGGSDKFGTATLLEHQLRRQSVHMAGSALTETQTLRAIERLIADALPPGWTSRPQRAPRGHGADAFWTLRAPDGGAVLFAVGVKRGLLGRQVDDVHAQLGGARGRPLVAAPYLSPTLRQTVEQLINSIGQVAAQVLVPTLDNLSDH